MSDKRMTMLLLLPLGLIGPVGGHGRWWWLALRDELLESGRRVRIHHLIADPVLHVAIAVAEKNIRSRKLQIFDILKSTWGVVAHW